MANPPADARPGWSAPRDRAGLILTAFVDRAAIGVGLADLSGKLITEHFEPSDLANGAEATLNRLCTLFDWLLEQHQGSKMVWGVGIAVPGPVEIGQATRVLRRRYRTSRTGLTIQ